MTGRGISVAAGPELVIGLIGPLGVDIDMLMSELESAFKTVSYITRRVSLIEPVLEYSPWDKTPKSPVYERYDGRMTAGNAFRETVGEKDALAKLAIGQIQRLREEFRPPVSPDEPAEPIPRCAYLLRSLKTPEEVATLREIYGPSFIAVAAYMPRRQRKESLMRMIAQSLGDPETRRHEDKASRLLTRDEFESDEYGQNTRDTFPLADVFIDVSTRQLASREALRFVEIVFGHPTHTPRKAEAAMFHAYGAKLGSASAGRQVGAAVVTPDGDLVAVGTNEVAKAHGGQYGADDADGHDYRDHRRDTDSTASMLTSILQDLLLRMQRRGWLSADRQSMPIEGLSLSAKTELLKKLNKTESREKDSPTLRDKALVEKLIEYMRSVHAEMAALTTCARLGVSVRGCHMYVTTFPCHECARLIVAAGIEQVFFIEPYPKSRVTEMYDDSIVVDEDGDEHHVSFRAFVGVAPSRFVEFFEAPEPLDREPNAEVRRRTGEGWVKWDEIKDQRLPRRSSPPLIIPREHLALDKLGQIMADRGLKRPVAETRK